jgi:hypothetical protein
LRVARLAERKRVLAELLADTSEPILYAEHLEGDGAEIYERACIMGLEGIVSKQQDAPYRSGRAESWIKVKCGKSDAFRSRPSSSSSARRRGRSPRSRQRTCATPIHRTARKARVRCCLHAVGIVPGRDDGGAAGWSRVVLAQRDNGISGVLERVEVRHVEAVVVEGRFLQITLAEIAARPALPRDVK